jgi:hypothetical protein
MKSINHFAKTVCTSSAAVLTVAFLALASQANAQYKPTGDDGITASPRVRAQLQERAMPAVKDASAVMACPKCKDALVAVTDTNSKGAGARTLVGANTKVIAKHLCEGCGAAWSLTGTGKAKQLTASHSCSGCGADNLACCSAPGTGNVATKGMDRKIQIAPLK